MGIVARTRQPFTKNDLRGDPQFDQGWVQREGIQATASFPLLVAGDLEGVLVAFFRHALDEEALEALAMLAALIASAVNDAELYDRAQRAIRTRDDVLSVVSHDLRGPLSIIEMGTTWLLRRGGDDETTKTVLRVRRAGTRMEVLIRDLLDESALEAGRLRIEPVKHAVGPLVDEAMELMRPIADEKGICLTTDVATPAAEVVCDRARIVQVFSNLVGNAIKFTNGGGAVKVRVSGSDGTVKFAVTDTGCGIAQEELPHVFDRYWKGHDVVTGVGLGLAIVKGIVEAHHGALHAESKLGEGSTFEFDLPRAA